MKVLSHTSPSFAADLRKLDRRHVPSRELQDYVAGIIAEVQRRGDAALVEFAAKFDGAKLTAKSLAVTPADVKRVANKYLTGGRVVLSVVPIGQADQASKPAESKSVK